MNTERLAADPATAFRMDGVARDPAPASTAADEGARRAPQPRPRLAAVPADPDAAARFVAVGRHALPANDFLEQLRREVRRTMRSGAALSLALWRLEPHDGVAAVPGIERLLETLDDARRETDFLGHVGDDYVAVLCTDTDADGVAAFVRKVESQLGEAAGTPMVATFPDPLFHHLADARGPAAARRLIESTRPSPKDARTGYPLKRVLDIAGASVALLLLSPLMLVVALLVKLSSPGPVVFRQTRLGHGGRPFTFYKFRSMRVNNDDRVHREFVAKFMAGQAAGAVEGGAPAAPFKLKRDPRITPIGAFLRRSSIDELPQFFNVLKGDMSLVGPRPAIPYEVEHYQSWHLRRILTARPGITGLWQVEGRSRVTFNDMVRMDLRYIRECSLGLDLKLLLKTVVVVFRADGAA